MTFLRVLKISVERWEAKKGDATFKEVHLAAEGLSRIQRERLAVIEDKLPFHYDDRPTILKGDISFLILTIYRLAKAAARGMEVKCG
jgi:hypothetical protein